MAVTLGAVNLSSFLRLQATAAMSMHLFALFSPLVLTLRMERKFVSVPNTGSTVLLRSFFMRFAYELCSRWCILS